MKIEKITGFCSSLELFERLYNDKPFSFFLDSGIPNEVSPRSHSSGSRRTSKEVSTFGMDFGKLGRFSFMGAEPFLIVKSKGRLVEVEEWSTVHSPQSTTKRLIGNPFVVLKELLAKYRNDFYHEEIPFLGGAVGYFSYDLCHFLEELPSTAIDDIDAPDMWVGFYDKIVAVDNLNGKAYVIARKPEEIPRPSLRGSPEGTTEAISMTGSEQAPQSQKREIASSLAEFTLSEANVLAPRNDDCSIQSNFLKETYIAAINRAKEYIRQGDIYQVNLSQRFSANLAIDVGNRHACSLQCHAWPLYKRLRNINPAPFAAYLDCGDVKMISASPERFLKIDAKNRYIETRPIKGTRPRGATPQEDEKFKQELINSSKDRAEHVMIVDLERNDLGRVCEYGSVKWTEPMILEKYSTVFHLVSTVNGRLRKEVGAVDCLLSCFPGGSITGAPKIRAMEIIDELEPTKRSVYTGTIGYIGFNGNMDTNIVIRTFINKGDKLYFQVGGGIVTDSDPEAEYQETLDKARALLQAIGGNLPIRHCEAAAGGRSNLSFGIASSVPSAPPRNDG